MSLFSLNLKGDSLKIFVSLSLFFLLQSGLSFSAIVPVESLDRLWLTDAEKSISGDTISFRIDRRASFGLALSKLVSVSFDYEADGDFLVTSASLLNNKPENEPTFHLRKKAFRGRGRMEFDFRQTGNWSPNSSPQFLIEGTGVFSIKNLDITLWDGGDAISQHDSALFYTPIRLSPTSVNYLTPAYWKFSQKTHLSEMLGASYLGLLMLLFVGSLFVRRIKFKQLALGLSVAASIVFSLHFLIRFLPSANFFPFSSSSEKIIKTSFMPELGILIATAKEKLKPTDRVAVMVEEDRFVEAAAVCFYLAPRRCVQYRRGQELYDSTHMVFLEKADLDVIVSYNADYTLPEGFEKEFSINKNLFIARRK